MSENNGSSTPRVNYNINSQPSTPRMNYSLENSNHSVLKNKRQANIQKGTQYITSNWRKALIDRNGKQELHFQVRANANSEWGPSNAHGNPLSDYSNQSNTRVIKNSPSLNSFNTSQVKTLMNGSKKNLKKEFNNAQGGKRTKKVKRTRSRKLKK